MSAGKILLALSGALLLGACGGGGDSSPSPSPSPPGPPLADTTPPNTSLTATPAARTNSTSANFTASATETGSVFEASLDNGTYAAVNASFTLTVTEGAHTVNVRARDTAGNTDASPVSFSWTVDTTPPDTQITSRPAAITSATTATFTFTSEAGATFEVQVVPVPTWVAATSPYQITGLTDGSKGFTVRARDAAGNVDSSPETVMWQVDTVPPETTIDTFPPAFTNSPTARFTFQSVLGGTYQVSLDGGTYTASGGVFNTPALGDGMHTLNVRAFDPAGNMDATPASRSWTVDTQAPDSTITSSPPANSSSSTASFSFTSEPNVVFSASIDGGAYARVTSPLQLSGLANGAHSFSVRATDAAGNVETQPATFNWQVNSAQPTARILFPTALSYTHATQLQVRGTANDPQGVASVSVNGVAATSTDAFANWSAQVPIAEGDNTLTVSVTDNAGDTSPNAASVRVTNRGVVHYAFSNTAMDAAGNRLFAFDTVLRAVLVIRGTDGYTSIFSDDDHGTGPAFDSSSTIVVDAPNNRLIVVASTKVIEVNLTTGNRTLMPMGSVTGDTSTFRPLVCNSPCTRLYGTTTGQAGDEAAFSIDLQTGTRTVISGGNANVGSGPVLGEPYGIALDTSTASPRLLITERVQQAVVAVDIASGARSLFAHASVGSGGAITNPDDLVIQPGANRLLVVNSPPSTDAQVLAIDLGTGNRSALAITGGPLGRPSSIALDPVNSRLLLSGNRQLDLNTGELTAFSGSAVGTGAPFTTGSLLLDGPPENRSLLLPATRSIVRVNLATGERTTVLTASYAIGPGPFAPQNMAFDTRPGAPPNHIVFTDSTRSINSPMTIFQGDFATGVGQQIAQTPVTMNTMSSSEFPLDAANGRYIVNFPATTLDSRLSGVYVATGIWDIPFAGTPQVINAMTLDPVPGANTRLLAMDLQPVLYAFNLPDGTRSTISSASVGTGPGPIRADGLSVDAARRRVLAVSATHRALQWIDLTNGNRAMVSGRNPTDASVRGGGPLILGSFPRVVGDFEASVAYVTSSNYVLAVDLVSGDRVITAR